MAKKINDYKITFLILFISLISFSFEVKKKGSESIIPIDFDQIESKAEIEIEESVQNQKFRVDFPDESKIPFYLQIELIVSGNYLTPILCFCPNDANCQSGVGQMVKNPNGNSVVMWIKREQFEKEDQEFYIYVINKNAGSNYNIKIRGDQYAEFGPNFVYSYLIGPKNKEMKFVIKGNGETGSLLVAIDGSPSSKLDVKYGDYVGNFGRGKYAYLDVKDSINDTEITTITITEGNEGDFITLSAHLIEENGESSVLVPNGPEIIGVLESARIKTECFKMSSFASETYQNVDKFYLTGRLHSQYAYIYVKDESDRVIKESVEMVRGGYLSKVIESNNKMKQICFSLPPKEENIEANDVIFTISLLEPKNLDSLYNYFPPQMTGQIYRRMLPKGSISFFSSTDLEKSAKKYYYNMYSIKGVPKMYIAECTTYPNCQYKLDDLNNLQSPKSTNQMTIWTTDSDLSSTLGNKKNVIVVHCSDDGNDNSGYCVFETSIYNKGQDIHLVENEKFSKFVMKDEKGTFKLDLGVGIKTQRVTVDIMIFSGDVNFKVLENLNSGNKLNADKEDIEITYNKYYLSNKIFFHFNLAQLSLIELNLEYTATLNSFFTIQYGTNDYNLYQLEEVVPSGESYLVEIDPTQSQRTKNVFLQNFRYKKEKPFLSNFFALNCDFQVKRGGEIIKFFDGYAQEVLTKESSGYKADKYNYEIKILDPDLSNYNHKMCMLYVSGIETNDDYEKEVIVGENINQQITFENGFEKVRFLYPQADSQKDLAINVNVVDQAYYGITIFFNNKVYKTYNITRTIIYYVSGNDIKQECGQDKLCSVIVQVELNNKVVKTEPMIEITIRQIENIPSYIQKGLAKRDFTCGDKFYYLYTDVGKNEEGEVLIDFMRDFGNVWGKIVRKDQTTPDESPDWRGMYRMPSKDWEDSLEYNGYIKKLIIRPENTADCIEGCYLLLSIRISQIGDYVNDSKFYPFSILTKISPNNKAYTDIPKIVIQVDEYIIGNVDVSDNDRIKDFYEVWLPHDADRVDFDWQSSVAGLYVNLGGTRPTTRNADFKLTPSGKDSIISLTKKQILDRAISKKVTIPYTNSLQDINLVIGVWTDKTSAIDTEIYSLRVHEVDETEENQKYDILEVNADKKYICKPHNIKDGYRCLFMITYDSDDYILSTPLYVHGSSLDVSAMTYMYASPIERKFFDEFDKPNLERNIPTFETSVYNSRTDGIDFIYIERLDKQKYIFLSVITDSPEDVMLLSGMPLFNYVSLDLIEFYPTPGKEQLLSCSNEKLTLSFATDKSILVNIVTLFGEAEVFWKNDISSVYSLRGRGDRLTLSSGKSADQLVIRKRKEETPTLKDTIGNPGFLFYISYYLKNPDYNYDEVIYGKSLEFAYKETDLPVVLFSKMGNITSDINVAVTFKDIDTIGSGIYDYSPILVSASLIKENSIYKAKSDPELAPSPDRLIKGTYDTALRTAQVMVPKEIISNFNLKVSDNPSLYLSIVKNKMVTNKTFDKFSVEVQFSRANEGVIPTEKVYHYGRVGENNVNTYYKLRLDKVKTYMRIQAAFNSKNVDFYINQNFYPRKNISFISEEKERGKIYITIDTKDMKTQEYLYIVFYKKNENDNSLLYNYVFKYINSEKLEDFVDYKILTSELLTINENINNENPEESTIECKFHKLDVDQSKVNITYFFKVVDADDYLEGEYSDTIAVTESPYLSAFARNPEDKNGIITLTAKGIVSRWTILQVIAQIQQETILEYVAYKGKYTYREPERNEVRVESVDATAFYVVVGILLILVIGLIIAIIFFKIRNQSLLEQVKHVSFQKTVSSNYNRSKKNTNVDTSNLIQKENANN